MSKVAAHVPLRKAASPQPVIKNKIHRPIPHRPHATLPGGKPKNPNIQRPEKMERPAIDTAVAATITPPPSSVPTAGKKPVTKEKPHEPAPSLGRDREPEAAGLILRAWATGNALWIKRGKKGDHVGEWAFPGGGIEKGESPVIAAIRETREETGFINESEETPSHIGTFNTGDVEFALYELKVNNEFIPTLNDESDAWAWAPLDDPPQPVHTGLKKSSVTGDSFFKDGRKYSDEDEYDSEREQEEIRAKKAQDKQLADDVESTGPASPEKIEAIKRAVYQAANELGFPTDKIKIVNKSEPHDIATMFDPRGTKASYDFDTGEMIFYPPGLKSDRMEYILPIFRHELMHMKFEQFLKSLKTNPHLQRSYESIISDPYSLYVGARDVSNYADVSFERYRHGDSQLKDALHETLADMVKYDRKNTRSKPLNALYALVEESSKMNKQAKDANILFEKGGFYIIGTPQGGYEVYRNEGVAAVRVAQIGKGFPNAFERAKQEIDRRAKDSAMDSDYEEVAHNGRLPRLEARTFGSFVGPVIKPNRGSFKATPETLHRGQFAGDARLYYRKKVESVIAMDKSRVVLIRAEGNLRFARLALDESMRSYDFDGRLHVKLANISKATVNPYVGNEIPDFKKLGLDPNKIYYLYRDPEELEKGAATFNLLPLLSEHQPVTANTHDQKLVVGSTGTDANFEAPFLRNSLVIWPEADIKKIEKNDKRQISCGYRYTPDMTPGVSPAGERYDGVMRDIVGNHVALVSEGRAGKDVTIEQ